MDRNPNSNHENFFLNSLSKYIKNKRGMEIKLREGIVKEESQK